MNTGITNQPLQFDGPEKPRPIPPFATASCRSSIATTCLVVLVGFAILASSTAVNAADEAKTTAKTKPPVVPPPLPPTPVTVVDGDVKVTGVVEISNTALPVIVQNDMAMQGTVEVLNDVLYQPFVVQHRSLLPAGEREGRVMSFDIPERKRLIIETVSVLIRTEIGQTAFLNLELAENSNSYQEFPFVLTQHQIFLGTHDYYVGCQAFKMRKDAIAGSDDEIRIYMYRSHGTDAAVAQVGIFGYLIDL